MKEQQHAHVDQSDNLDTVNEIKTINHNGFTQFPPLTQLLPPIFIILATIQLIIMLQFINHSSLKIAFIVILLVLFFVLVYFWVITTKIDPTDSVQIQHRYHLQNKIQFDRSRYKFFCNTCRTCVGNNSFHCNKCYRCVQLFDHHCKWLNNCIGAKNYVQFVILVGVCLIFMIYHFGINVWLSIYYSKNEDQWKLYQALSWIILDIIPSISLIWLISLHIYLIIYKKSTIALIMQNRQKNKIHPAKQNNDQSSFKQTLFRLNINSTLQQKTKKNLNKHTVQFKLQKQVQNENIPSKNFSNKQNRYPIKLKPLPTLTTN